MLNQVVLVGRLVADPEVSELESGKKVSNITLAVQRSFKNADGVYEADFVKCALWDAMAQNTSEYCHKGDVIGVKGRVQTDSYEKENSEKGFSMNIVAEKVTFLTSKDHEKDNSDRDDR